MAGAWWQYQLVQNLTGPLPTPTTTPSPVSSESSINDSFPDIPTEQSRFEAEQQEIRDIVGLGSTNETTPAIWALETGRPDNSTSLLLNTATIENAKIGDRLSFNTPDGESHDALITNRKRSKRGVLHLNAHYIAYGEKYSVLLTQSEKQTFGTVNTPNGIYELSATDGKGKLISSAMLEERINPEISDIIPAPSSASQ